MGYGRWTRDTFEDYSRGKGRKVDRTGAISGDVRNQDIFLSDRLDPRLDPKNVMRECCDSEEHPETIPVILALDVTGSMGEAAVEVAKQLNVIMTKLFDHVKDVEFLIMGIGDFECDRVPVQMSQFESDIRIAEQLERLYFEFGGGGNAYESYTAAWYMAARHTRLDCWKRGKKGILITMGDEPLNPYIPMLGRRTGIEQVTGDRVQGDIETRDLYEEVRQLYDVYHLDVIHGRYRDTRIKRSFMKYLDEEHFRETCPDRISNDIICIIKKAAGGEAPKKQRRGIFW
ncbi:MAG: VWA domain-containing protein [Eubacterium sp.]|nr:VWA domain-containing protein [Eubacterium sp.]